VLLDQLGKNSCLGTEKDFIDSIGNGVLSKFRNLKKPFGLLEEFLEEDGPDECISYPDQQ
jgi:hypothetical protein